MKQLIHTIKADFQKEGFTRRDYIVYGVLAPIAFLAVCILASAQY